MAVTFGAFTVCKFTQEYNAFLLNVVTSGKEIDFKAFTSFKPFVGICSPPIRARSIVPSFTPVKASRIALNSLSPALGARLSLIEVLPSAISWSIADFISSALFTEMTVASSA